MNEKRAIRREMSRARAETAPELKRSWDLAVTDNLLGSGILSDAGCVYCYYSTKEEVDTTGLMQTLLLSGKKVACPRVEKGEISFYLINALTDCCPGFRGICEPVTECEKAEDEKALVILPGLAFSTDGDRIGYGGGYYDRFLASEPMHATVALAYPFQVVRSLPADINDFRAGYIITPDEIIKTNI